MTKYKLHDYRKHICLLQFLNRNSVGPKFSYINLIKECRHVFTIVSSVLSIEWMFSAIALFYWKAWRFNILLLGLMELIIYTPKEN